MNLIDLLRAAPDSAARRRIILAHKAAGARPTENTAAITAPEADIEPDMEPEHGEVESFDEVEAVESAEDEFIPGASFLV